MNLDLQPSLPGKFDSCRKGARQAPCPIVVLAMIEEGLGRPASPTTSTIVLGDNLWYYVYDRPGEGAPTS